MIVAVVLSTARLAADNATSVTIAGKVTDEHGKPIAGAHVRVGFERRFCECVTGSDGAYRVAGCDRRAMKVVVFAPGRALEMRDIVVDRGMRPVDFRLPPGGRIRVRVVDERGRPIPRPRLRFHVWRNSNVDFAFAHVPVEGNEQGVWEWREAPVDDFQADVECPGRMVVWMESLDSRKGEFVFRPPPATVISGRVVDAVTKRPIEEFTAVPGARMSPNLMRWYREQSVSARDGAYRIEQKYDFGGTRLVRIEADGYEPGESGEFKSREKQVTANVELARARDFDAIVFDPDGKPAAGAKAAVCIPDTVATIADGDIRSTNAELLCTDTSGRLHLRPQKRGYLLAIVHPSGYALFQPAAQSNRRLIQLDPWSRVEGTYRVNGKPLANVGLTIMRVNSPEDWDEAPQIWTRQHATTGPNGRFAFAHVMARRCMIGRRYPASEINSICQVAVPFLPPIGETRDIELNEQGLPITGRLRASRGSSGKANWQSAAVEVDAEFAERPGPHWTFAVNADGTFRTAELPSGAYTVKFRVQAALGHLAPRSVAISTNANAKVQEPLDLGELMLIKD